MGFESNEALFAAVETLAEGLERRGRGAEAGRLREGLGLLNGLTDGWALFLEAVEGVEGDLTEDEARTLKQIGDAAHEAVYRRKRPAR